MANLNAPKKIILQRLTTLIESTLFEGTEQGIAFTTLAGRVFRGRMLFGVNDPDTMVSIVEAPQGSFAQFNTDNQVHKDNWILLAQGWCPDDKVHPSDPVYDLAYAVEKTVGRIVKTGSQGMPTYPSDYLLGKSIADFQFGPSIVRAPALAESSKAFFYLPMQVTLASDVG